MEQDLLDLIWRGIEDSNPWWKTGKVPPQRTASYRRQAFASILETLNLAERGRGVVVLGPRRVGKTVIVHQLIEQLLTNQVEPSLICFLALDDVALRGRDIGELLQIVEDRNPIKSNQVRILFLDEVQHSKDWSLWLKRIADRKDPYKFFATGSSATALRHGNQDAGLGRWREITLLPWSFREHVEFKKIDAKSFQMIDVVMGKTPNPDLNFGSILPAEEAVVLDKALNDYFLTGGFPEVAAATDLLEARRRIRQDILDRSLGRDITDVVSVDPIILERLFLRVCQHPGGLWNETTVAQDLGVSRPTVSKYVRLLEEAFLIFRLPNLASPIKGLSKMYLVTPSLRAAMLALSEKELENPNEWGLLTENAIAALAKGLFGEGTARVGFWRKGKDECDVIVSVSGKSTIYIESKRSGTIGEKGIFEAAKDLKEEGYGYILGRTEWTKGTVVFPPFLNSVYRLPAALWLYVYQHLHDIIIT